MPVRPKGITTSKARATERGEYAFLKRPKKKIAQITMIINSGIGAK